MSSQFLSLEEAAKRLGISNERMVDLRSQGKIRGFRDGASWKFPANELDRLADDLASESGAYNPYKGLEDDAAGADSAEFTASSGGSGVLVDEAKLGSSIGPRGSKIIGGDAKAKSESGNGSDVNLGSESSLVRSGSDVNLIADDSHGGDVRIVTGANLSHDSDEFLIDDGKEGLIEIDSGELQLSSNEPVISHDSAVLDLAIEPNAGSTGPITDQELKEVANKNPDLMVGKKPIAGRSGLAFDDDDSDDDLIGVESEDDMLGADLPMESFASEDSNLSLDSSKGSAMSSLEMLDDLDLGGSGIGSSKLSSRGSRGVDVLSELDLLSADAGGSGLITGDSGEISGSGLGSGKAGSGKAGSGKAGSGKAGSGKGGKGGKGSNLNFDDALADDDDLVIADDEDDLVLGGGASDVSVSGDSGINLMSPSDSGLSLESEPLDLAGSSISALDLGSEFGGGSGGSSGLSSPAKSGVGSAIDFHADEDFRLSPSAIGGEADDSSQVIEIEDSSAFADANAFGDDLPVQDAFGDDAVAELDPMDAEAVEDDGFGGTSTATTTRGRLAGAPVYEVPFSIFQVSMLLVTLMIMSLGGMLMTDLLRNMWAYTDTAAPVNSLTDALISLANFGG